MIKTKSELIEENQSLKDEIKILKHNYSVLISSLKTEKELKDAIWEKHLKLLRDNNK